MNGVPVWIVALMLALASATPRAEIHKCRQGARLIYQEAPCPAGSQALPPPPSAPRPSAYAAEEARQRASNDIAAAEALRQRELKEAEALRKQEDIEAKQAARKLERECAAARDRAKAGKKTGKRGQDSRKKDRRDAPVDCGAL